MRSTVAVIGLGKSMCSGVNCLVGQAGLATRLLLVSVLPAERDGQPDFESPRRPLAMKGGHSAGSSSAPAIAQGRLGAGGGCPPG